MRYMIIALLLTGCVEGQMVRQPGYTDPMLQMGLQMINPPRQPMYYPRNTNCMVMGNMVNCHSF